MGDPLKPATATPRILPKADTPSVFVATPASAPVKPAAAEAALAPAPNAALGQTLAVAPLDAKREAATLADKRVREPFDKLAEALRKNPLSRDDFTRALTLAANRLGSHAPETWTTALRTIAAGGPVSLDAFTRDPQSYVYATMKQVANLAHAMQHPGRTHTLLSRAGLDADLSQGVSREQATALMDRLSALPEDSAAYGPRVLLGAVLQSAPHSLLELDTFLARFENTFIVRPDGWLTGMLDGSPLKRLPDLTPDTLYVQDGGRVWQLDDQLARTMRFHDVGTDRSLFVAWRDAAGETVEANLRALAKGLDEFAKHPVSTTHRALVATSRLTHAVVDPLIDFARGSTTVAQAIDALSKESTSLANHLERLPPTERAAILGRITGEVLTVYAFAQAKAPTAPAPAFALSVAANGSIALRLARPTWASAAEKLATAPLLSKALEVASSYKDISPARQKALLNALGHTLAHLGKSTGARTEAVLAKLGAYVLAQLAPKLSLEALEELATLAPFASAVTPEALAAAKTAAVKSLPSVAHKTLDEVRDLLKKADFEQIAARADQEVWAPKNRKDPSIIRISLTGTKWNPYLHLKKEIAKVPGAFDDAADILCKLTDDGLVMPRDLVDVTPAARTWLESNAGRSVATSANAAELDAVRAAWGNRTHIKLGEK